MSKNSQSQTFVAGNFEDKYTAKNPISKFLMGRFLQTFESLLIDVKSRRNIKTICEVGCGEGELLKILHRHFPQAKLFACDLSQQEINKAKKVTKNIPVQFSVQNAEHLDEYKNNQFDLVICCEVLEHLDHPEAGLQQIRRISTEQIVSVPVEPLWRVLNLLRFKYVPALGNTPGHLNHWSVASFQDLVRKHRIAIQQSKKPLPWQMYLLETKS